MMLFKISDKIFKNAYKYLFVILIAFLPQFAFIGSYLNTDSLAILSISIIIYGWILGIQEEWSLKSCIILGVGIGICALSYYNAYGFILVSILLYVLSNIINKEKFDKKKFLKKGLIIALIAFIMAGWWFIRNAVIYNGDFLGLSTENEYAEKYAMDEFKPSKIDNPKNLGYSLWYMIDDMNWVTSTFMSFIAIFGSMDLAVSMKVYLIYFLFYVTAAIGVLIGFNKMFIYNKEKNKDKQKILLNICFVISVIIPIILSIYYSYTSDFQPQGRYIMPMVIPFIYLVVNGIKNIFDKLIKNNKIANIIIVIISIVFILICLYCLIGVVIPTYSKLM